jgi:hypothetical protein
LKQQTQGNLLFTCINLGGALMYKMQLCNVYTQEVLREAVYDKPDMIHSLIDSAEKNVGFGLDSFIFDNQQRTLKAEYVTYSMIHESEATVYKIFFKVKLSDIQAMIR